MGEHACRRLGVPALLVAFGGTLTIVHLPLLGAVGVVVGVVLGAVGCVWLRRRVTDRRARRAATVAVVAWLASSVARAVPVTDRGELVVWLTVAVATAGAVAIGAAAVAGAREEQARGRANLAASWWTALGASVVCHGPFVVALVLSAVVDRTLPGVRGTAATLTVLAVLVSPLVLLGRAGWRSDVVPRRTRSPGRAATSEPPLGAT